MSSKNDSITIGQILEMRPGTKEAAVWVNGEFEAVVSDCKPSNGKGPATCLFTDPHIPSVCIVANFFGGIDPSRWNGKIVHVSGSGISRTEYKGTQGVTLGAKATVQIVGDAKPGQASARANTGTGGVSSGTTGAPGGAIHGATVGMAINQACECIRHIMSDNTLVQNGVYFESASFSKDLWRIASDIIRVSQLLESGKLAKSAKDRADPEAAAREEAAKKAEAERIEAERIKKFEEEQRAANITPVGATGADEDVPF